MSLGGIVLAIIFIATTMVLYSIYTGMATFGMPKSAEGFRVANPNAGHMPAEGFEGSSSSNNTGTAEDSGLYSGQPTFLSEYVNNICKKPEDLDTIKKNVKSLLSDTTTCDTYSQYANGIYVKNACYLANMYANGIDSLLTTALTSGVGTAQDKEGVKNITISFCENQIAFDGDQKDDYLSIVQKFNKVENTLKSYVTDIPTTYSYKAPDIQYKPPMKGIKSYSCVTFGKTEQQVLQAMKQRTLDTPTGVKNAADTVELNLCKEKGGESGKGAYKGCTGCGGFGCCIPSTDPLPTPDPLTGTGTITSTGKMATMALPSGTTKCPQPAIREYRLQRKPAKFRKVEAPTPAFMECFEDSTERQLGVRELLRAQKGAKMYDFAQRVGV